MGCRYTVMPRISVRRYRSADAAASVDVEVLARTPMFREVPAAFEEDGIGLMSPEVRSRRAVDLAALLETSDSWVALIDEQIVGFVAVTPHQELTTGTVVGFAIDPRWRGQGVASALLARSHGVLQTQGLTLAG